MSARWGMAALLVAGCGGAATDPCSGRDGTCLGVHVQGSGAIAQVDQIAIDLAGAVTFDGRTPSAPGDAIDLPVVAAVFLPSASGRVDVAVTGFLHGGAVGSGAAATDIAPGAHAQVTVVLAAGAPIDAAARDLADAAAPPPDAAATDGGADLATADAPTQDLSTADLSTADLSTPDLSMPDLSMPDLSKPDLAPPPRLLFTLPAHNAALGTLPALDQQCTLAATQPNVKKLWPNHQGAYAAIITYPNAPPPVQRIPLQQNRPIVRVDGIAVAADPTLWLGLLKAPANLDYNGQPAAACAWTNTRADGTGAGKGDCTGWTNPLLGSGGTGNTNAINSSWLNAGTAACPQLCAVYCIEL